MNSGEPAFTVATLVRVRGEVDIASAQEFRKVLTDASAGEDTKLLISLEECTYFDSTGLAVLVGVQRAIRSRLKIVVPPNTAVYRIFEITGLHRALNVVPSTSQAFETWYGSGHAPVD